jgi:hypothetical protein
MRSLVYGFVASLLLSVGGPAGAQAPDFDLGTAPFTIEAERIAYEEEREIYEAEGDVRVVQTGGRSLTADWLTFSARTRIGVAVGNVELRDGEDVVRGDFLTVDLETLTAMATQASVGAGEPGMVITGQNIQKTGENTYSVEQGVFTTCRCPRKEDCPPWEVTAGQADVEVGGYAVARDVKFKVLGTPLLYTPWLMLPVKTERQTGLLIPNFSRSGNNGMEIELPFFWAVNDRLNLLLTPEWLRERGFKTKLETEYVFGEQAEGYGGASLLSDDRAFDHDDPREPYLGTRWAYWLRHEQPLAQGTRLGTDLQAISDNSYVVDFEDLDSETRSARLLDSRAWASSARIGLYGGVEAELVDDVQNPNDIDRDDFLLQRLPDVRLASLPRRLGPLPLRPGLEARYTHYYQREHVTSLRALPPEDGQFFDTGVDGLFDPDEPDASGAFNVPGGSHGDNWDLVTCPSCTEGDGRFQEGELLADRGHRVDLYPSLALPLRLGPLESLSELGFRETLYFAQEAGSESRSLWTGRVDLRTRLARDFSLGDVSLRHILEPKLAFTLLEAPSQLRDALFVPSSGTRPRRLIDADPRVVTRHTSDRIDDERLLHFSLGSLFYRARGAGSRLPEQLASLRLGSGYDFLEGRMADVFVDGTLTPGGNLELAALAGYDTKKMRFDEGTVSVSWFSEERFGLRTSDEERRHRLAIDYRFLRDEILFFEDFLRNTSDVYDDFDVDLDRIHQLALSGRLAAARRLDLFGSGYLSFEGDAGLGWNLGATLLSECACWDLTVLVQNRTRPNDLSLRVQIRLAGLGTGPR